MRTGVVVRLLVAGLAGLVLWFSVTATVFAATSYSPGTYGNDISYPQCGSSSFPTNTFGIVGVTGGRAFTTNSCFASEFDWVSHLTTAASLYMNLNSPIGSTASNGNTGPYGTCAKSDTLCHAENYGYNAAQAAYTYAQQQGASSLQRWLDIETGNSWSSSTTLNQGTINGGYAFSLRKISLLASTPQRACGRVLPVGTRIN
jgi:hypothetical protein